MRDKIIRRDSLSVEYTKNLLITVKNKREKLLIKKNI